MGTYRIKNEDHTLGNALRSVLVTHPEVDFVAYSKPHPLNQSIQLRVQSKKTRSIDLLKEGCDLGVSMCDLLTEKYKAALKAFDDKAEDMDLEDVVEEKKVEPMKADAPEQAVVTKPEKTSSNSSSSSSDSDSDDDDDSSSS